MECVSRKESVKITKEFAEFCGSAAVIISTITPFGVFWKCITSDFERDTDIGILDYR